MASRSSARVRGDQAEVATAGAVTPEARQLHHWGLQKEVALPAKRTLKKTATGGTAGTQHTSAAAAAAQQKDDDAADAEQPSASSANNRRGSSRLATQSAAPASSAAGAGAGAAPPSRSASASPSPTDVAGASALRSGRRTVHLGKLPGVYGLPVRFTVPVAQADEEEEAEQDEADASGSSAEDEEDAAATAQKASDTARLRAQRARRSPSVSPSPRNGSSSANTTAAGGAPSPTASVDSDNDTTMKDAADPRSSPSPSSPNSIEEKEEAEAQQQQQQQQQQAAAPPEPPVRLVRSSMVIPVVPPRKERLYLEDLPPYVRPPLKHVVSEEKRVVQVRPRLNQQRYPEQLIDATMTLKTYLPSAAAVAASANAVNSHLMSPFSASRAPLTPHLGGHHPPRTLSLSHSPGFLGRRQTSANGASAAGSGPGLSAAAFVGISPPGSPKPRSLLGGSAAGAALILPQTPAMHRQSSQLTHPLQSMQREGPPTNIVTQLIPYGRIHIVPARVKPQLCASMVPLSPRSSAHSWYLPKSQASRVHIQLELPGGVDFEIVIDNVYVLPEKFDVNRLKAQQQRWGLAPPPAVNSEPMNAAAAKPAASVAAATGSASVSSSFHVPSSKALSSHSAHRHSSKRSAASSTRLERKKDMRTETERMLDEDEAAANKEKDSSARVDALTLDLHRAYGHLTKFGPPKLRDVRVSIRSKGQTLVPEPAHAIEVPVYDETQLLARSALTKPAPAAAKPAAAKPSTPAGEAAIAAAGSSVPALAFLQTRGDGWRGAEDDPTKDDGRAPRDWTRTTERSTAWGVDSTRRVLRTETKWVSEGSNALSVSNPRIVFSQGSITLERCKPRLGGWVVRREISMQAAAKYMEANPAATEAQVAKLFPASAIVKKEEEALPTIKAEDRLHSGPLVKMEDVPQTPQKPAAAAAGVATPASVNSPAKAPTTITFVPRAPSPMPPLQPAASVYEPAWVAEARHDIAEVGDVIRLELHIPAAPLKAKSKPIKPLKYELIIEGIRVLPTNEAPSFPEPLDLYRYGTAPREMVLAAAQRNYLTSSAIPSHRLAHPDESHWSSLGRPKDLQKPVFLPDALLPHEDSLSEQLDILNNMQFIRLKLGFDYRRLEDHSMLHFFQQFWHKDAVLCSTPRWDSRPDMQMIEACLRITEWFSFSRDDKSTTQFRKDGMAIVNAQDVGGTTPEHLKRPPGQLRQMLQMCSARLGTDVILVSDEDLPINFQVSEDLVAEGRAIFKAGPEIPRRAVPVLIAHVSANPQAPRETDLTDDHTGLLGEDDVARVAPHRTGMPLYIVITEGALFVLLTPLQLRMANRGPVGASGRRALHLGDPIALKELREHEAKFGVVVEVDQILTEMKLNTRALYANVPWEPKPPPSPPPPAAACDLPSKNEWRPAPDRTRYSALVHHPQAYDEDVLSDSDLSDAQNDENNALLAQYNELLDDEQGDSSEEDSEDGEDDEDESGDEGDEHDEYDGEFTSDEELAASTSRRTAPGSGSKGKSSSHQSSSRASPATGAAADKQRPQGGSSSAKGALFKPAGGSKPAASAAGSSSSASRPSSSSQFKPSGSSSSSQKRPAASSSSSKSASAAAAAAAAAAMEDDAGWDEGAPEEVWACCDKCSKWRKLPPGFKESDLPEVWHCSMNPDVTHNLCKYPQEEESQDSYPVDKASSSSAAAGGGSRKAASSAASSSRANKDDEKSSEPTPVSHAVQQAHLALLYPPPRVPTHEDVCTFCEEVLAKPEDGLAPLFTPEQTLMCHGPCARIWHRKCVKLDDGAQASAQSVNAVSDQQRDAALSVTESGEPLYVEAGPNCGPTTHVYPFTPKISKYWYCSDCINLRGYCFSCFKPGTCDPTMERVPNPTPMVRSTSSSSSSTKAKYSRTIENEDFLYQCPFTAGGCGKMYHRKCLFNLPRTMTHKPSRGGKDANMAPPQPNLVPRPRAGLTCSLHMCCSCQLAGTISTNVRDIGRTLVQCLRCPSAYHWTTKCRRSDCCFVVHTRKYGVCDDHDPNAHPDDAEDADLVARRKEAQAQIRMHHGIAPQGLWGSEPLPPEESDSDDDDDDEDDSEDDAKEEEVKKPASGAASKSGGAGAGGAAAGAKNKAEKAEPEDRAGKKQRL